MSLIEQQYLFNIYTFLFQYRVELKLFQLDKDNSNPENYFLVDPVNKYVRSTRLSLSLSIEQRNALNKYFLKPNLTSYLYHILQFCSRAVLNELSGRYIQNNRGGMKLWKEVNLNVI